MGEARRFWSKVNCKDRKEMVVVKVTRIYEEHYRIIYTDEVGCLGFVRLSSICLLRDAGSTEEKLKRTKKELAEEAEKVTFGFD